MVVAAGQRLVVGLVALWDRDGVSADDLIGSAGLELRDLALGVVTDDWMRGPVLQGRADGTAVRVFCVRRAWMRLPVMVGPGSQVQGEKTYNIFKYYGANVPTLLPCF